MVKRGWLRMLSAMFSLVLISGLVGCSASDGSTDDKNNTADISHAINDTERDDSMNTETEAAVSLLPTSAPTAEQIAQHEKILLWQEDHIPYLIEDDEKGLMPTIRAYLCEGADSGVVIFPGGGYFQLSDEGEGTEIAKAYNEQGFSAFVVNYRYEPYDGKATLADGLRAIQYVRYFAEDFGLNPDKIAVCGFSAGGHLAVMTAEQTAENIAGDMAGAVRSTPDACVLVYPVTTLGDGTYETMPRIFLGDKQQDADEIAKYSYSYNLAAMPSTFICYSVRDNVVDYQKNSIAFADAMKAIGGDVERVEYTDGTHGGGLGTQFASFSGWHADSVAFLKKRGF